MTQPKTVDEKVLQVLRDSPETRHNGSIQEIVLAWLEKYMATNPITGNCTYKSEIVKDEVDVQIKFGCSASFEKNSLNLNGEFSYSKKKSVYLLKYTQ